jgi:hypothetical protein
LVAGPRWVPDTKTDWLTDFGFDFDLVGTSTNFAAGRMNWMLTTVRVIQDLSSAR